MKQGTGYSLRQNVSTRDSRPRPDREARRADGALGNAHWRSDRADAARLYCNEGLYLAEVERNMTSEALLRLRLAQIDGEEEELTECIELGKRALTIFRNRQILVHCGR